MKKFVFVALTACSFAASASPYLGLEYGFGTTSHDVKTVFNDDNITLEPKLEDGIFGGFLGYSVNPSWAIELGYSQFELDASQSVHKGIANGYIKEWEWDSSIHAKQWSIAPVYTHALNSKWTTKLKAGLTYTQYKANAGKYEEQELIANDDVETSKTLAHSSQSTNEVGALVAIGTEYAILPQLTLGANVKFQLDSYANTTSFNIGTTYYF